MTRNVKSKVTIYQPIIKKITKAAATALEKTGEYIHTEVVQAQVIPRDTGALQDEKMFVDYSESYNGHVSLVHEGPYSRRLYYHPEYNFHKDVWTEEIGGKEVKHEGNPHAKGKWFDDWLPGGSRHDGVLKAYATFLKKEAGV